MYLFVDYLGGLTSEPDALLRGSLSLDDDHLQIETRRRAITIPIQDIASIEVVSEHAARTRGGIGRLFAVLGAPAKGDHDRATLLVHTHHDQTAGIRVPGWSEYGLRDHLAPWLDRTGVEQKAGEAGPAAGTPFSVADELRKLADLHQEGLLSDEEFAAQRAKLLG